MSIWPKHVKGVLDFITEYTAENSMKLPTLEECKAALCPDVSEFKNKRLVFLLFEGDYGGYWEAHWLCDPVLDDFLQQVNPEFYLGDIDGKWSVISENYKYMRQSCTDNPYEIFDNKKKSTILGTERDHIISPFIPKSRPVDFDPASLSAADFAGQVLLYFSSGESKEVDSPNFRVVGSYELFPMELWRRLGPHITPDGRFLKIADIPDDSDWEDIGNILCLTVSVKADTPEGILAFCTHWPYIQPETHFFKLMQAGKTYRRIFSKYFNDKKKIPAKDQRHSQKKRVKIDKSA